MGMPSDNDLLLEFADDEDALEDARKTLESFGDAYRYQLIMARHLEHHAAHLEELRAGGQLGEKTGGRYADGYVESLRHTADSLKAGEFLPGGSSYDETITGEAF